MIYTTGIEHKFRNLDRPLQLQVYNVYTTCKVNRSCDSYIKTIKIHSHFNTLNTFTKCKCTLYKVLPSEVICKNYWFFRVFSRNRISVTLDSNEKVFKLSKFVDFSLKLHVFRKMIYEQSLIESLGA